MLNTEFTVFWIKKFFEYSPGWIAAAVSICVIVLLGRWLRAHFTGYLTGYCAIFFFLYFFPVTAYINCEAGVLRSLYTGGCCGCFRRRL